jgi:hypothetical protein
MNVKTILGTGIMAWVLALQGQLASANLINITTSNLPEYLQSEPGSLALKTGAQGEQAVYDWLYAQWEVSGEAAWGQPEPTILGQGTSWPGSELDALAGHYLVVHWGTGQAGQLFDKADKPNGGFNQAFYIASTENNLLEVPVLMRDGRSEDVGGLSFWRVYDPERSQVPDVTWTFGLSVFALGLVLFVSRKTSKLQTSQG